MSSSMVFALPFNDICNIEVGQYNTEYLVSRLYW